MKIEELKNPVCKYCHTNVLLQKGVFKFALNDNNEVVFCEKCQDTINSNDDYDTAMTFNLGDILSYVFMFVSAALTAWVVYYVVLTQTCTGDVHRIVWRYWSDTSTVLNSIWADGAQMKIEFVGCSKKLKNAILEEIKKVSIGGPVDIHSREMDENPIHAKVRKKRKKQRKTRVIRKKGVK